ncbi:MAG: NAD(P)-binding domain-containing protein [Geminicoccaceae bacterium]
MHIGLIGQRGSLLGWTREAGLSPVVHAPDAARRKVLAASGVTVVEAYPEYLEAMEGPRVYLLDVEPGETVDATIDEAYVTMEPGDVVLDMTGSYWGDTLRRYRRMRHRSLFYIDLAMVGPTSDRRLLAGGDERAFQVAGPVLDKLAGPSGLVRSGAAGSAHYALMVADAVRTTVAHALSEAHQLLEAYPSPLEVPEVVAALAGPTEPAGTRAPWLLDDAVRLEAAIPLLAQAVMLELGVALDEHRSEPPPPRVGGFVHPDDIL